MANPYMVSATRSINVTNAQPRQLSSAWTLDRVVCWTLVAAIVFLMGADFRGGTGEQFSVHWQIYLRLLLAFVSGVVGGLLLFPKTVKEFFTWPGLLLTGYVLWYAVTLPMSLEKSYSAAAWISLVGVLVFIPSAMRVLGGYRFLTAIAAGLSTYLVGSWIAFLFFPQIGVFMEQVTRTEVYERMGGLGHPNELGFYSAYTVLVFAGLGVSRRISWTIAGCGMLLGAVTLFGCFSRTAIIVCTLGLVVMFQHRLRLPGNFIAVLMMAAVFIMAVFAAIGSGQLDWAIEDALEKVTKTGDTDELATATGRTAIWQYGIKQIALSPLYGYGYCSSRFIMEDYSYHCHNIVLNALMYGGVVSGLLVVAMICYLLFAMITDPQPEVDGLAACMLAGGMVEGLLGSASPAASLVVWFTILFWRQLGMQVQHPKSHIEFSSPAV